MLWLEIHYYSCLLKTLKPVCLLYINLPVFFSFSSLFHVMRCSSPDCLPLIFEFTNHNISGAAIAQWGLQAHLTYKGQFSTEMQPCCSASSSWFLHSPEVMCELVICDIPLIGEDGICEGGRLHFEGLHIQKEPNKAEYSTLYHGFVSSVSWDLPSPTDMLMFLLCSRMQILLFNMIGNTKARKDGAANWVIWSKSWSFTTYDSWRNTVSKKKKKGQNKGKQKGPMNTVYWDIFEITEVYKIFPLFISFQQGIHVKEKKNLNPHELFPLNSNILRKCWKYWIYWNHF